MNHQEIVYRVRYRELGQWLWSEVFYNLKAAKAEAELCVHRGCTAVQICEYVPGAVTFEHFATGVRT